jgi:uncharacterized protein (TIGR02594 family)
MDRRNAARWEEEMSFATLIAAKPLRFGTRNPAAVRELQKLLNETGARLNVDGKFGRNTQDAVVAFQEKHGLDPDGIVGPLTARALELAVANPGQPVRIAATSRTDFSGGPVWWQWALHEIGISEIPGPGSNSRILEYRTIARTPSTLDDDDLPWCAIFVNAALEANGLPGSRSARARSFETHANFASLNAPTLGCIVTFWRGTRGGGLGHVGLYRGETDTHIYVLGGNQGDSVSVSPFQKSGSRFGFSGYWWPRDVPRPLQLTAIPIRTGDPLVQVSVV